MKVLKVYEQSAESFVSGTEQGQDHNLEQIVVDVPQDGGVNSNDRNFAYFDQI